jgi:hypothetical protein
MAPVYDGPVYAIRNTIYRTGAGNNDYPGSSFNSTAAIPSQALFICFITPLMHIILKTAVYI